MENFSQNKKIAISAVAIFIISFSIMIFFLGGQGGDFKNTETNILHAEEEKSTQSEQENLDYLKIFDPVFVTDNEGVILKTNKVFCHLIGVKCKELAGKSIFDYIKKGELPEFAMDYSKIVQNDYEKQVMGPYTLLGDNTEKLVLFSVKIVFDKEGKVEKIIFSGKDLSDRIDEYNDKEAEKEKEENKSWIEKLYPTIKELNEENTKLLVDKVSYKKNN